MSILTVLRKPSLIIRGTFSNLAADNFLTNLAGDQWNLIAEIDWERIIVDLDVTALTGTNCIFKLKTCVNPKSATAITATTLDAKNGAGTAIVSSTMTAAGRELISVARLDTDSGPSNIGAYLGLYADTSSITDLDGEWAIYLGK